MARKKANRSNGGARKRRVLALMHESLVPPESAPAEEVAKAEWKTEYHVVNTLRQLGHEVRALGLGSELGVIRAAVEEFQPHIAFNLLEGFDDVPGWDANVIAYLELLKVPYTGCNSRGLLLSRDKSITKKLLTYHRIPVADFSVFPRNRKVRRRKHLKFPLIVKSLTLDASIGISQASVVEDEDKLAERVRFIHESIGTDALVERYIEGRELYVGVLGNERLQALPVWELLFQKMPEDKRKIATERLKWSLAYQKKHGIDSEAAQDLPPEVMTRIQESCKRV
jgi:D-alanine-D-alanine ligase